MLPYTGQAHTFTSQYHKSVIFHLKLIQIDAHKVPIPSNLESYQEQLPQDKLGRVERGLGSSTYPVQE